MTAVPAMGVVAETMVAVVLATERTRKFGGDCVVKASATPRPAAPPCDERPAVRVHLALVGMIGSGKTTIGVRVAAARHRTFLDSDQMIEAHEGRTVRDIWLADGEPAYRAMESEVLREALASPDPVVIGAAGGVVLREENRQLLERADVLTVRLQAWLPRCWWAGSATRTIGR